MIAASLFLAAGLLPDFARAPWLEPAPVFWETPVSQESPPALISPDKPPVIQLAEEKEKSGRLAEAQAGYEKILAAGRESPARLPALAGFKRILARRAAAGEKGAYGPWLKILKDEWRNEEALELAAIVAADPKVPAVVKAEARALEPLLNLRLGRFERAAELWAKPRTPSETRWLAETERRRGRFAQAAALRLGLAVRPDGRTFQSELEAAFFILAKGGLYREALELAQKYPVLKQAKGYWWFLGLAALGTGEAGAAAEIFKALTIPAKYPPKVLTDAERRRPGAWYFLGRALEAAGRPEEARAAYGQAAAYGAPWAAYYRLLAEGRLGVVPPAYDPAPLFAPLLVSGPSGLDRDSLGFHLWITEKALSGDELEKAAAALAEAGPLLAGRDSAGLNERLTKALARRNWAEIASLMKAPELRKGGHPAREYLRPIFPRLAAAGAASDGDYRLALSFLAQIEGGSGSFPRKSGHPLVFSRPVLAAFRDYGLSPALLLALIRAESAYQPQAISASNARGLMQLLPVTAEKTARALNEAPPGELNLFYPETNIRYGSWYLSALLEGFGHEALALAAYNGGPHNIKSLVLARPGLPLDIFIESLWAEETVNYVKRILVSRQIYEAAYIGRSGRPDLTRPVLPPRANLPDF